MCGNLLLLALTKVILRYYKFFTNDERNEKLSQIITAGGKEIATATKRKSHVRSGEAKDSNTDRNKQ